MTRSGSEDNTGEIRLAKMKKKLDAVDRELLQLLEARVETLLRLTKLYGPKTEQYLRRLHEAGFSTAQAQLVYDLAAERLLPLIAEAAGQFEAEGGIDGCRAGYRFMLITPEGYYRPCAHKPLQCRSRRALIEEFSKTNTCRGSVTSSTKRSPCPCCGPERSAFTGPCPGGSDSFAGSIVLARSTTIRSGSSSAKTSYSTGADNSMTSRVPSGPDHNRTSVTRAGPAHAGNQANDSTSQASRRAVERGPRVSMARNLPRRC